MQTHVQNYGAKYWSFKKQQMYKMDIAVMRMLKYMCGKSRKISIINKHFQEHLGVPSMWDKTNTFDMI